MAVVSHNDAEYALRIAMEGRACLASEEIGLEPASVVRTAGRLGRENSRFGVEGCLTYRARHGA